MSKNVDKYVYLMYNSYNSMNAKLYFKEGQYE